MFKIEHIQKLTVTISFKIPLQSMAQVLTRGDEW